MTLKNLKDVASLLGEKITDEELEEMINAANSTDPKKAK